MDDGQISTKLGLFPFPKRILVRAPRFDPIYRTFVGCAKLGGVIWWSLFNDPLIMDQEIDRYSGDHGSCYDRILTD